MASCESCRFYQKSSTSIQGNGECRLNPPTIFLMPTPAPAIAGAGKMGLTNLSAFPSVQPTMWCGKYENREQWEEIQKLRQGKIGDCPESGLRLLKSQAVTLSAEGQQVRINCDSFEDAQEVFDWLEKLA